MAESGLSMSSLCLIIDLASSSLFSAFDFKYDIGTESKTASITEHKKEVKSAMNK
jgi:hypothetical protein